MKHEKEWYTCDRCGEEIKENIYAWKFPCKNIVEDINVITNESFVTEDLFNKYKHKNIDAVSMIMGYRKKEKIIHLCGKCRKDFERFMKHDE